MTEGKELEVDTVKLFLKKKSKDLNFRLDKVSTVSPSKFKNNTWTCAWTSYLRVLNSK